MDSITVHENGHVLTFTWDALLAYHGGSFPGGVVHGLKAMQAAFPLLSSGPLERREIEILTAFTGPGGRDVLECVTRALTDGRLKVNRTLGGGHAIDDPPGPYLFRFSYRGRSAEATMRPGYIREEFVTLGALQNRDEAQENRLTHLKSEMADRLRPMRPQDVYDARLEVSGSA